MHINYQAHHADDEFVPRDCVRVQHKYVTSLPKCIAHSQCACPRVANHCPTTSATTASTSHARNETLPAPAPCRARCNAGASQTDPDRNPEQPDRLLLTTCASESPTPFRCRRGDEQSRGHSTCREAD